MTGGTHLSFYAHQEAQAVQERAKQWFTRHNQNRSQAIVVEDAASVPKGSEPPAKDPVLDSMLI